MNNNENNIPTTQSQKTQATNPSSNMQGNNVPIPNNPSNNNINNNIEILKAMHPNKSIFSFASTTFIVDKKYTPIKRLGQGAYGMVCSCKDESTGQIVAMKKVQNAFNDLIDAKRIVREIRLLHFLNHPCIIKLLDIEKPEDVNNFQDIYFSSEYMDTDLHKVIYSKQPLSDSHFQYFMYQILAGVNYIHSANVIHRDLKPCNILINKNCEIKICDFGLGRAIPKDVWDNNKESDGNLTEYVVTRWYRAPEIVLTPSKYSKAVDVWSIGCIFAELLGRTTLFRGEDYLDQIKKIINVLGSPTDEDLFYITIPDAKKFITDLPKCQKIPFNKIYPNANPLAIDLLEKMLVFNPLKRITIQECLEHPYFKEIRDQKLETTALHPFDWSFDSCELNPNNLRKLIYEQSLYFHPY